MSKKKPKVARLQLKPTTVSTGFGAGTTTNGGANGGSGGPYNMQAGVAGGVGKLTISY